MADLMEAVTSLRMAPSDESQEQPGLYNGSDCLSVCPTEVLHMICHYLPTTDVESLRLVCKRLTNVGNDHLDIQAYACFKRTSLEDLERLSKSRFRKSVRSLCYDANHFTKRYRFETWCKIASDQSPEAKEKYPEAYERFTQYFLDQDVMIRENLQALTLKTLLENCPYLDTVKIWTAYEDLHTMERARLNFADAMVSPRNIAGNELNGSKAFVDVMRAIHQTGAHVRRFSAQRLSHSLLGTGEEALNMVKAVMKGFKCFSLEIFDRRSDQNRDVDFMVKEKLNEGVFSDIIGAAQGLTHLSLRTAPYLNLGRDKFVIVSLDHVIGSHVFHHLRSLELRGLEITESGLRKFLLEHKTTLRSITLTYILLRGATGWRQLFSNISQLLPHVRKFMVYGECAGFAHFGFQHGGRSTLLTHAMDKFLRKGGDLPDTLARCYQLVPEALPPSTYQVVRRNEFSTTRSLRQAGDEYIDSPGTDIEYSDDEEADDDDEAFWK